MPNFQKPFFNSKPKRSWGLGVMAAVLLASIWAMGAEKKGGAPLKSATPARRISETTRAEKEEARSPAAPPSLKLSQFCISSPEISCVNPTCHPQPPTSADSKPASSIMKEICVQDPKKSCTDPSCHYTERRTRAYSHPLYLNQRCERCHVRPDSPFVPLVKAVPDAACLTCHVGAWWRLALAKPPHPPGKQTCTTCHSPHQSRVRNLLRTEQSLLDCALCHEPFLREAEKRPYYHRHFEDRVECGFCHYAHRQGMGKFVRENTMESCLSCHDLPIRFEGRVLENVKKHIAEAPVVHGAIRKGTCPICHTPHGSDQPALLKPGYPAGSHEVFRIEQYALCLQCHPRALLEEDPGVGVTEFRTAEKNLHRFHAMQIGRGRACHLCHEPHASQRPHLLRETIRFRLWNAPFDYTTLPDGGRCLTACHREREYHRTVPAAAEHGGSKIEGNAKEGETNAIPVAANNP